MDTFLKKHLHQLKAEKLRKEKILKKEKIRQKSTRELTEKDKIFLRKNGIMNGCGRKNR